MGQSSLPAVQAQNVLDFISHSLTQTLRIGQRLGSQLQPGDLILLLGEFGVGKTQLVKGIAQGLESQDLVTSPSFVMINEYQAGEKWQGMRITHADFYRIEAQTELSNIGLEELWNEEDVCLIEWAERAERMLPAEHLNIHLRHLDESKRIIRLIPYGKRYEDLIKAFKRITFR